MSTNSSQRDIHDKAELVDYECALIQLISHSAALESKWKSYSLEEFCECLKNAERIHQRFTIPELTILIEADDSVKVNKRCLKT